MIWDAACSPAVIPAIWAVPRAIPRMTPVVGFTDATAGAEDDQATVPVAIAFPY